MLIRSASSSRLFERVRDEDDGDAAPLEIAHEIEEIFLLLGRQGRGGLVENDDLGAVQHRAGDFHHLLLGGAERADDRRRRDVEIERLQELLRGDVDAAGAIVEFLLTEKQVLRHRHGRDQRVLLKHHADAEIARLQRGLGRDFDAVYRHNARGQRHDSGHHLGERRFAGAILADQRMNLAARQVEIDFADRRHAGIKLGRVAQRKDRIGHPPISLASADAESFNRRPGPLARMKRASPTSTAARRHD